MSVTVLTAICAVFLLAGFIKGVVGLGLPTIAVGGLTLVMAPAEAVAIMVVPSLVTNIWQIAVGPSMRPLARRLWPLMLTGTLATIAGCWLGLLNAGDRAATALGVALAIYALLGLFNVRFAVPPRHETWLSAVMGTLSGFVTAATGVFVMPAVPYIQSLDLDREGLIQALGLWFTVATIGLAIGLGGAGAMRLDLVWLWGLALAASLVGMAAGQWMRSRIPPATFRFCFLVGLLALGLHLALHTLF